MLGQWEQVWKKNCLVIGLVSGFLEFLEFISIYLIQKGMSCFVELFLIDGIYQSDIDEYNCQLCEDVEVICDFIIFYYYVMNCDDLFFWCDCCVMDVLLLLKYCIQYFCDIVCIMFCQGELFVENFWVQVMMGQGIQFVSYYFIMCNMDDCSFVDFFGEICKEVVWMMMKLFKYQQFID